MQHPVEPSESRGVMTSVAHSMDAFNALVQASFMPLEVTTSRPDFTGRIRAARRDDVYCYEIAANEHIVQRTPRMIETTTTGEFYKLSTMLSGTSIVLQDDREAVLGVGDVALYDTTRPYTLISSEGARTAVVMLPRQQVELPPGIVRQLTAVRLSSDHGMTSIISPFIASLAADLRQFESSAGARLARNLVDLVTTMLVSELDIDDEETSRRALLRRVCAYIDDNLGDPALGPGKIAAAHFISVRYLQVLFQREGTTASAWIRQRRLERCRRDLTDPVMARWPIAGIAARWGFLEPTHFSRVFKDHFGRSARDIRAAGQQAA